MLVMLQSLSPVVCLVCRQQNGSAQADPCRCTCADLWRNQERWVKAQSFRKSKHIIKTKKEHGITDEFDTSDRGEWGHSSKEYSGPSRGDLRRSNCTKTLHHNPTLQVLSYPVRYPRVLRYSELHLLSFRALLVSGAWTISVLHSRVLDSRIRTKICIRSSCCCNSAGKERDSHPRISFLPAYSPGTLSQVGTKRCPVLCYVPCRRVRKLSAFSFRKHGC